MRRSIYTLCKTDVTPLQSRLQRLAVPTGQQRRQYQQQQQQHRQLHQRRQNNSQQIRYNPYSSQRAQRITLDPYQRYQRRNLQVRTIEMTQPQMPRSPTATDSNTTFVITRQSVDYPLGTRPNDAWDNVGPGQSCIQGLFNRPSRQNTFRSSSIIPRSGSTVRDIQHFANGYPTKFKNNLARMLNGLAPASDTQKDVIGNNTYNIFSNRSSDDRRQNALKEGLQRGPTTVSDDANDNSNNEVPTTSSSSAANPCKLLNRFHKNVIVFLAANKFVFYFNSSESSQYFEPKQVV